MKAAALLLLLALPACDDAATSTDASSSTGSATTTGASSASSSSGAGGSEAEPFTGPADTWTWTAAPGTKCGNGSPAGVEVNLHPASTDLLVVVSGGGACWSDEMCNGAAPASVHVHDTLTAELVAPETPMLGRDDPQNPLSSATWAYVPYCTGDLHWGDRTEPYPGGAIEHRGASNMRTFLQRLRATRPDTKRVFLFGGSAGGYGVTLHWGTAKEVFGDGVEVHVLADASPLVQPKGDRYALMKAAWAPQFPASCTGCSADPGALVDALALAYPTSRHGLLVYDADAVLSQYFGFDGDLPAAIDALRTTHHDPHANTKYFIGPGTDHGVVGDTVTAPDGSTPTTFLVGWLAGAPSWHSVRF